MEIGQAFAPRNVFVGIFIPRGMNRLSSLGGTAKRIFGVLMFFACEDRTYAYPSHKTICEECGISRRACIAALQELESAGFIRCIGLYHRNKIWEFLWHACFEESVRNTHTSKRDNVRDQHTTPQSVPSTGQAAVKCADSAHDSVQSSHMIVCTKSTSYMNRST